MQYAVVNVVTARFFRAHRVIGELFRLNNDGESSGESAVRESLIIASSFLYISTGSLVYDKIRQDLCRKHHTGFAV